MVSTLASLLLFIAFADLTVLDDILSDILGPDDSLGLDHASKSRGFWSKSESFFIR